MIFFPAGSTGTYHLTPTNVYHTDANGNDIHVVAARDRQETLDKRCVT